jgi:uracil phosphoribosyltransferase
MESPNTRLHLLTEHDSIACALVAQLRDKVLQQDAHRYRANTEKLGRIAAYEISKTLAYKAIKVETQLGIAQARTLAEVPVLVVVLRAGLPFYNGFLDMFPESENAFIGAYRQKPNEDHSFEIAMDYVAAPSLEGKTLLLIDPMLATGKSLVRSYEVLQAHGKPARVLVASLIASSEGIDYVTAQMPEADIYTFAIDAELNGHKYIVPGLGDAGDLSFGEKL